MFFSNLKSGATSYNLSICEDANEATSTSEPSDNSDLVPYCYEKNESLTYFPNSLSSSGNETRMRQVIMELSSGTNEMVRKTPNKKEEMAITDRLRSIIEEVEAIASGSAKDENPTSPMKLISNHNDTTYNANLDLTSGMESIIDAAIKERDETGHTIPFNAWNVTDTICDSFDKQDFDLPNKLYNFIAEATEEMDTEGMCFITDCERDSQHSELSNLVADALEKLELEVARTGNPVNKNRFDGADNYSSIVALDMGSASVYVSSDDIACRDNAEKDTEKKKKFVCHHCYSKWSNYYMVKSHIVWNHIPEIEKKHVYRIGPNQANVNTLNRIFDKFYKLKSEKQRFSPFKFRIMFKKRKVKYYKCRQCEFKTPKEYEMRKHKSQVHNKLKHQCFYCNYCSTVQSCLLRHVMARHTKEKPFKCTTCDYRATQHVTLQEHIMAKHTFEKPHQCPYCDYASVQRSILKDHIKAKHTHDKNRQCSQCSFASVSYSTLKRHIMAKHTNEKPYKCEHCNYSATQSGQLRKHVMAIHTNEKPFRCSFCPFKATQSHSLKIHQKRKHSKDIGSSSA
ncbi:zinc finger autosomal protein [Halyomorpha halys]|uniref:zinc finger autosomal protein n=1 Tax=Halyomorpha halys TaxID=286706 RepID=UPI0006D51E98|nr:zinc finger protein 711-like [Halyomorpha halys]XP_014274561.1 zinc finger protein 711-like [Halyomorpha halys]XP_014274562.1 zinc finger protein 711-like [Halyomorpha halys]XP_014274563.1 zinc finger protein 711-like [Halyomorpha halys]XP_014274564.1 zinc finger protein 711-like [Halyomorpha halys]